MLYRFCQLFWSHFFCFDRQLANLRAESQVKFSFIISFSQFVFLRGGSNIQILFALEGPYIHHNRVKVAPLKNWIAVSIQTVNRLKPRSNKLSSAWFSSFLLFFSAFIATSTDNTTQFLFLWSMKCGINNTDLKVFYFFNQFIFRTHTSCSMSQLKPTSSDLNVPTFTVKSHDQFD